MTIKQALSETTNQLFKNKTKFPHLEAEILLSHILKKPREYLFAHPETELTKRQVSGFRFQVSERLREVPIAYITGEKEFYGLKFLVNKNILIPRPETELMVEEAMRLAKSIKTAVTFIDIGTGSGCIAITLTKLLAGFRFQVSGFRFYASDISKKSLVVAKKNAKFNGVDNNIKFFNGDLLTPLIKKLKTENCNLTTIILANLPYLTPAQIKKSPTLKFDPKLALSAGPDGLKYYRQLFKQILQLKLQKFILLCEIDPSQKSIIKRLAKIILPPHKLELKKDLRGHNRLAVIIST